MQEKTYIAIDLKSFYASVECVERGLDPLEVNLVVADKSRTEKTICLAVTPALKAYGIPGRARLFEVIQAVDKINQVREQKSGGFVGKSYKAGDLADNPRLALDYIIATPQMRKYMLVSSRIVQLYMQFVSQEDIYVYSVDEVFIDATSYLEKEKIDAEDFAIQLVTKVKKETGITATAGVGPNLFLCKIAMDIEAKHKQPNENGARVASLSVESFREKYWDYQPMTDFWRFGKGIVAKLEKYNIQSLGDICRCSIGDESSALNEDLLYKLFGINAELIIDHAWGYESTTIEDIRNYMPSRNKSLSSGQVLSRPYSFEEGKIIIREMTNLLVLSLVEKQILTDQIVLTVGYDALSVASSFPGETSTDFYGRKIPKHAHGSVNLDFPTSSSRHIMEKTLELYERIMNPELSIRRIYVVANHLQRESGKRSYLPVQENLFSEMDDSNGDTLEQERLQQEAILSIHKKYGKNALLTGTSLREGATAQERNSQVGGHRSGGD